MISQALFYMLVTVINPMTTLVISLSLKTFLSSSEALSSEHICSLKISSFKNRLKKRSFNFLKSSNITYKTAKKCSKSFIWGLFQS